ncbi:hypothetical protein tinsulaeT_27380 [Thalassotalea insulae]|uniref:Flagellar brake protein n=1 Tax=Thalassotalea insulae TaxID=2056778 RepID=A0ABQ6GTY0_9GAMM|nr:flagellar brake domain-containing protein [Thalassotalea insulae]GLX79398.1 hypothetical protein tinsulaeT_27380 [Thalassotalea insulae]
MPSTAVKVNTASRLQRNLSLMQAGSVVTIDIATPAGQKGKFRTTFVGYLPKKYVLLQYPETSKIGKFSHFITQGMGVTVRGIIEHEGAVVAFVSSIKQTLQLPSKMIVLEFPKTLSMQCLRKSIRIEIELNAKVRIEKKFWQSLITDISISGCQLLIENGDEILLVQDKAIDLALDSGELNNLKLSGQICSMKSLANAISLGVQFNESSKNAVIKLLHHVVTLED